MRTPLIIEQFVSGPPGKALLEAFMAIYLPSHGYWITGAKGMYAWSEGSEGGMRGDAHPIEAEMSGWMVAKMHQDSIAYAMNQDAGFAAICIGPGKFRGTKLGLTGYYAKWLTMHWDRDHFEILPPIKPEEVRP